MVRMASFQLADSLFFKTFIKLMSKKKKEKAYSTVLRLKTSIRRGCFFILCFLKQSKVDRYLKIHLFSLFLM